MRIYGKFENVGSEYETLAIVEISTKPFKNNCKYLDIKEGRRYKCIEYEGDEELRNWKQYNGTVNMGEFLYNPKTKEYINSRVVGGAIGGDGTYVELEDGRRIDADPDDPNSEYITYGGGYESEYCMFQEYKEGKPIGDPYFE